MPSIPQYDSQAQEIPQKVSYKQAQATGATDLYKDIGGVENTVGNIIQKLSDANDVMQETKAKVTAESFLAQQEQAAQNDPNPDNAEMHIKAIDDMMKNATKGIDNQEVAGQVALDIGHVAYLSQIKIQDDFKKKQMFANYMSLDQLVTTTAANKANAVSAAAGQQDEDNLMETISKNVNTRLITPEWGMQLVKQYKVGVVKNKISQNTSANEADYKGLTDGLDLRESNIVGTMIKARIKENEEANVRNTLTSRVDTLNKVATNQLTWREADEIEKVRKYDPKQADALQQAFENQTKYKKAYGEEGGDTSKTDHLYYTDLIDSFFNNRTKKEASDDSLKVISGLGNGITKDQANDLMSAVAKRTESLPTTETSDDAKESPFQKSIDSAVNGIKDFVGKNVSKGAEVFSSFFKNISSGSDPHAAKTEAIKTYNVKNYAWISNLPKEGAIYRDKSTGAKRRIFPDGSFKEEQ